jgi:hypothetical protein
MLSRKPSTRVIHPPGPRQVQPVFWLDLAICYYVGARAAAFWNHRPNADIQAHHAIELALKWALVRPLGGLNPWPGRTVARTPQRVKSAKHNLMALWTMLNGDYPGHPLQGFSTYIQHLDRVELLMQRYREMPAGGAITYIHRFEDVPHVTGAEVYAIDLPRLDALFHGLLALTGTDSAVVRSAVVPGWPNDVDADKYYRRENASAVVW